jgi:hypothetical protein
MRLKLFIIFFFLSGVSGFSFSIDEFQLHPEINYDQSSDINPISFDPSKTEKYQNDPYFDYTEKIQEDNLWEKFKRWLYRHWVNFWTWLFGDFKSNSFLYFLYQAMPYIIIGGIVVFLIWLFYKLNPGSGLLYSKEEAQVFFTEEEKIIKSEDIQALIDDALANKNYRLAVRYYFLLILKSLSEKEIINYQFDKTNSDYIKEIKQEHLSAQFKKSAFIYEYVWYGNFDVSETDFTKAKHRFVTLKNNISKKNE